MYNKRMKHPSRIFALYLFLFLIATAVTIYFQTAFPFVRYLLPACFLSLLFFWQVRPVRYALLLFVFLLLPTFRLDVAKKNSAINPSRGYYVAEEPKIFGRSQAIVLKGIEHGEKVEVIVNQFPQYQFGETVKLGGELKAGEGSEQKYKLLKGISKTYLYPTINKTNQSLFFTDKLYVLVRRPLIEVKNAYSSQIGRLLSAPESGLLAGILLGIRSSLSESFLNDLSKTGTIHIIALSGFNITILAEFMRILTRNLSRKSGFFLPLITIWAFVMATGFSSSIIRAAIMGSLLVVGGFIGRRSDALLSILFACFVMVFLNPFVLVYDLGFQLSFAATVGIFFLAPVFDRYLGFLGAAGPYFSATLAAQLLTWPITSFSFGTVSLISPIVNVFILPLVPPLMLIGFIVATLGFVSVWLAKALAFVPWTILAYLIRVIKYSANLKFAAINYKIASPIFILGYYLVILDVILFFRRVSIGKKVVS